MVGSRRFRGSRTLLGCVLFRVCDRRCRRPVRLCSIISSRAVGRRIRQGGRISTTSCRCWRSTMNASRKASRFWCSRSCESGTPSSSSSRAALRPLHPYPCRPDRKVEAAVCVSPPLLLQCMTSMNDGYCNPAMLSFCS